jgi:uncharacterized protein
MKLEQTFEVAAPLERVWEALIDVERVAPCLPGAAVTGRNDDGSYNGTFKVKIGPTSAAYTGKLAMENVDESAHTATMDAQGTDKRGQGGAKATIVSTVADAGNGSTRVEVVTDYHITGRLARFGRGGMIEDISERLLREFAKRLQSSLASLPEPVASAPAEAVAPGQVTRLTPVQPASAAPDQVAPAASDQPAPMAPDQTTRLSPVQPAAEAAQPEDAQPEPEAAAGDTGDAPDREADTQILPTPDAPPPPQPPVSSAGEEVTPPPLPPPSPGPPPVVTPPPSPGAPGPPTGGPGPAPQQQLEPSEPLQGLSLVGGVVWGRVKRNPAPVAAAGVAVVLLLARRRRRRHA